MSTIVLQGSYSDQALAVGGDQLSSDRRHGCDECTDRSGEACNAMALGEGDVVDPGGLDGLQLGWIVELAPVDSDYPLVAGAGCVGEEEAVLLALPAEVVEVVNDMGRDDATEASDELDRNVLV